MLYTALLPIFGQLGKFTLVLLCLIAASITLFTGWSRPRAEKIGEAVTGVLEFYLYAAESYRWLVCR